MRRSVGPISTALLLVLGIVVSGFFALFALATLIDDWMMPSCSIPGMATASCAINGADVLRALPYAALGLGAGAVTLFVRAREKKHRLTYLVAVPSTVLLLGGLAVLRAVIYA